MKVVLADLAGGVTRMEEYLALIGKSLHRLRNVLMKMLLVHPAGGAKTPTLQAHQAGGAKTEKSHPHHLGGVKTWKLLPHPLGGAARMGASPGQIGGVKTHENISI